MEQDAGSVWRRWRLGVIVTVLLHGAALSALSLSIREPHVLSAPPSFAVEMIPAPPSAEPRPETPPEQAHPRPVPPDTPPPPIAQLKPAPNGFVLPPPTPPVVRASPAKPLPAVPPPPPAPPPAAAVALAPTARSATSKSDATAKMSWEATVLARLEAAKRYPASARFAKQEATITVRFDVDRSGHVLKATLLRPSGIGDLDGESLALLKRVHLPPPPVSIDSSDLTLTVPIEFMINRG